MQNPWAEPPAIPPYVLPADRLLVQDFNGSRRATESRRLRLDVLPEPFIGRADAPVILLNINPGYTPDDVLFTNDEYAREVWRRNARHESNEYPFYPFDPTLSWTPTAHWWTRRLRQLVSRTSGKTVANRLLCIEYFPYHSYRDPHFPGEVPSQAYSFALVEHAIDRGSLILIMRGVRAWRERVPRLNGYPGAFDTKNPQSPFVSPGVFPDAYEEVVRHLTTADRKTIA